MEHPFDKNKDGVVSKGELKRAIKEVMQEAQEESLGQNRGKKMARTIKNLFFVKTNMSSNLKSIYLGNGTPAQTFHTGDTSLNITNCHTRGLSKLRQPINVKSQTTPKGTEVKKGSILDPEWNKEQLEKLRRY